MPTATIYGHPAPKGSMKCIGSRGRGGHQLIEDKRPGAKEWRGKLEAAGAALLADLGSPMVGPLCVWVTFTLARPKSVTLADRVLPWRKHAADVDKLARMALDGLADSGLFADDVQVCRLSAEKVYPDSPHIRALPREGAMITVRSMQDDQHGAQTVGSLTLGDLGTKITVTELVQPGRDFDEPRVEVTGRYEGITATGSYPSYRHGPRYVHLHIAGRVITCPLNWPIRRHA